MYGVFSAIEVKAMKGDKIYNGYRFAENSSNESENDPVLFGPLY